MTSTMSGAEMRVALHRLGLTLSAFSKYTGWDSRTLTRQSTGVLPVPDRVEEKIRELEAQAKVELERFNEATEEGIPIFLPRLSTSQEPGGLPPHWWLAIAARCQEAWGEDAQFEWE